MTLSGKFVLHATVLDWPPPQLQWMSTESAIWTRTSTSTRTVKLYDLIHQNLKWAFTNVLCLFLEKSTGDNYLRHCSFELWCTHIHLRKMKIADFVGYWCQNWHDLKMIKQKHWEEGLDISDIHANWANSFAVEAARKVEATNVPRGLGEGSEVWAVIRGLRNERRTELWQDIQWSYLCQIYKQLLRLNVE